VGNPEKKVLNHLISMGYISGMLIAYVIGVSELKEIINENYYK